MNITLSETTVSPQKTKLQKEFDKLWQAVKNKQLANAKLKTELADLHKIYQDKILPIEQLTAQPYTQLVQRLIEFFSRKSLTQWQRHELSQWILECIEHVQPLNAQRSCELMASYQQVLADYLGVDVEEIKEEMNPKVNPLDELFDEFEDLDDAFNDAMHNESSYSDSQDDLFGFSENEDIHAAFEDAFASEALPEKPKETNMLSDKWLRMIFRRTANVLHPDKERNADLRKAKEGLMSQLLTARDEKDIFSMLNLYMQHVDSDELLITDETMGHLCEQLKEQKNQLTENRDRILYENPMYTVLYENLYAKSHKTQERNIESYIQRVEESIHELSGFVASLRNLEMLKVYLRDRYDEHRFASLEKHPCEFYDFE